MSRTPGKRRVKSNPLQTTVFVYEAQFLRMSVWFLDFDVVASGVESIRPET
jgi:hypothetical protein